MRPPESVRRRPDAVRGGVCVLGARPFGATCGECEFLGDWRHYYNSHGDVVRSEYTGGCSMFRRLGGKLGPVVPRDAPSCKYFERREP
jgi:hypothetical protein